MGEIIIPWITDERQYEEVYADELKKKGVGIQWLEHAGPALRQLERQKVQLILLNPWTAPGPEYIDDVVASLMNEHLPDFVDYWKIGAHVIKRLREPSSANRETPIIVADYGLPSAAEHIYREAGATAYFVKTELSISLFVRGILHYVRDPQ